MKKNPILLQVKIKMCHSNISINKYSFITIIHHSPLLLMLNLYWRLGEKTLLLRYKICFTAGYLTVKPKDEQGTCWLSEDIWFTLDKNYYLVYMSSLGWVSGVLFQSEQSLSSLSAPSKWNRWVFRPWATTNNCWPPSSTAVAIQEDGDTLNPKSFPLPSTKVWEIVVGTSHSWWSPKAAPNSKAEPLHFTNISACYNFPVP